MRPFVCMQSLMSSSSPCATPALQPCAIHSRDGERRSTDGGRLVVGPSWLASSSHATTSACSGTTDTTGTYIFQEDNAFDAPGSHTVVFDNRSPLAVGEYVVNIYVGTEAYLADSFQLVIGDEVTIPTPEGAMPEVEGMDVPTPDQGINTPNVDPVDPQQGNSVLPPSNTWQ